jgi:tRNA isopentenyl-2-thiomethyl-A-37 hydroxylase MiaE
MSQIPPVFGLPPSGFSDLRDKYLPAYLRAAGAPLTPPSDSDPRFSAGFFGLDQLDVFRQATPDQQRAILKGCGLSLLQEAHHIEEAGMSYGAKMALAADSIDSRMIYSMVSSDEARHFQMVRRWLPSKGQNSTPNAFHALLANAIQIGSPRALVPLIQVVLEGWGLHHYSAMARDTGNTDLQADLASILRDEARHHQLGLALTREKGLSAPDSAWLEETLVRFLQMVQLGPQAVVAEVAQVLGGLTGNQRVAVFRGLNTQAQSQARLDLLQKLLSQEGMGKLAERLEAKGCFQPARPEECA